MQMAHRPDPKTEVLAGLVERVTFRNPESGFCVPRVKARGRRDLVTTVGHAAMISAGEWVTASGEWSNNRTHGLQVRVRLLKASAPSSLEGTEKPLGSGMIRGVGPIYAQRMVRRFGEDVLDVIEASPDRLREAEGVRPMRAARITSGRTGRHKSRGSECPAVVIPVLTQHYAMLQRNLLHTGVTRGKRLMVLGAGPGPSPSGTCRVGGDGRSWGDG